MSTTGDVGQSILLELQLEDEAAGLFPQVTIYTDGGAVEAGPLDLADRGGGLYQVSWTATEGQFSARFLTFSDAAHTTRTNHEPGLSHLEITDRDAANVAIAGAVWDEDKGAHVLPGSFGEATIAAAGHAGLHCVLDGGDGLPNIPHNTNNNMTSARLRIFATAADAAAATMGAADGADGEILRLFFDSATYNAGNATASPEVLANFLRTSS